MLELADFVYGSLNEAEYKKISDHLDKCEKCSSEVEELIEFVGEQELEITDGKSIYHLLEASSKTSSISNKMIESFYLLRNVIDNNTLEVDFIHGVSGGASNISEEEKKIITEKENGIFNEDEFAGIYFKVQKIGYIYAFRIVPKIAIYYINIQGVYDNKIETYMLDFIEPINVSNRQIVGRNLIKIIYTEFPLTIEIDQDNKLINVNEVLKQLKQNDRLKWNEQTIKYIIKKAKKNIIITNDEPDFVFVTLDIGQVDTDLDETILAKQFDLEVFNLTLYDLLLKMLESEENQYNDAFNSNELKTASYVLSTLSQTEKNFKPWTMTAVTIDDEFETNLQPDQIINDIKDKIIRKNVFELSRNRLTSEGILYYQLDLIMTL